MAALLMHGESCTGGYGISICEGHGYVTGKAKAGREAQDWALFQPYVMSKVQVSFQGMDNLLKLKHPSICLIFS